MISCFLFVVYGEPSKCPDELSRDRSYIDFIENREKLVFTSTFIGKFSDISKADKVGIFIADDNLNYIVKIAYLNKEFPDILSSDIYPIIEEQQRTIYRKSFTEGCVVIDIKDITEGNWKAGLKRAKTEAGILCSIKSKDIVTDRLQGFIVLEYNQRENISDPSFVLNSLRYYREELSRYILEVPKS